MEKPTITRRTFLKASAIAGVAAAVVSPGMLTLKGLVQAKRAPAPTEEKLIMTTCRMCRGRCGMIGLVRDGRLIHLEGNEACPTAGGRLCAKAYGVINQLYHPDRLKYPLKRTTPRGQDPKWVRISWDEALDTVGKKFREYRDKYGGRSIIGTTGTSRDFIERDFSTMSRGSFDSFVSLGGMEVCYALAVNLSPKLIGHEGSQWGDLDRENVKCYLWQSAGVGASDSCSFWLPDALEKGAKLIVVDPRFSDTAARADIWLPVRPGTDMAWMLAFLNIIISEKLYDQAFVEKWTNGTFLVRTDTTKLVTEADIKQGGKPTRYMVWDQTTGSPKYWDATIVPPADPSAQPSPVLQWEAPNIKPALFGTYTVKMADGKDVTCKPVFQMLADHVKEWTAEKAAEITWVPADKIRAAALLYAKSSPGASFYRGHKFDCSVNSTGMTQAMDIMIAILGNLDVPGGQIASAGVPFRVTQQLEKQKTMPMDHLTHPPELYGIYRNPGAVVRETLLTDKPYPIKAIWQVLGDPVVRLGDNKKTTRAFMRAEFILAQDIFMNPTVAMADIVLPAAMGGEVNRVAPCKTAVRGIAVRQKFHEPLWECKDDVDIYRLVAERVGFMDAFWPKWQGKPFQWTKIEDILDWQLQPLNMTWEDFKKKVFYTVAPKYRRYETGELRRDRKPGVGTADGKVQLFSQDLQKYGWGPFPIYVEPPFGPYGKDPNIPKEYPLICISGARSRAFFHSEYRELPWLREIHMFPECQINNKTAADLGIKDGDWVWIESPIGKIRMKAVVTPGIHPRVIEANHNWWFPEKPAPEYGTYDCNINTVISAEPPYDPAFGSYQMQGQMVKVYKAPEGPPEGIITKAEDLERWMPKKEGGT